MGQRQYLTPDVADGTFQCRPLFFPTGIDWLGIVNGALLNLCNPYNFEEFGTASAQEAADAFSEMVDKFAANQGVCRMVGEIILWSTASSPDPDWLTCDGTSLLRTDYPDLFAVIGVTYGAADVDHFSLPDLRGRTVIGIGTGSGLTARALGDIGGEEVHTLTTTEAPSHTHADAGHTHSEIPAAPAVGAAIVGIPIPSAVPGVGITGVGFASLNSSGGNGAHNNIQPFIALNYLIVAR